MTTARIQQNSKTMCKENLVKQMYRRAMSTPCSCVVIHPRIESMKTFEDAYAHIDDVFRFDETYPKCDFMRIPKNVPVLMIGPGDRMGLMAKNYSLSTKVKKMKYLTKVAFYREYMESITGKKFMPIQRASVAMFLFSSRGPEYATPYNYEIGLRDKQNIIGLWPFSIEWAKWHGLYGVFCKDIILDMETARQYGLKFITEDDMLTEQQRIASLIMVLINPWPSHKLNVSLAHLASYMDTEQTFLARHNNNHILVINDDTEEPLLSFACGKDSV